jgi:hypothetical protein
MDVRNMTEEPEVYANLPNEAFLISIRDGPLAIKNLDEEFEFE